MNAPLHRFGVWLLVFLGLGSISTELFGSDDAVVAVLSSELGPYKEALQGFEAAYGHSVPSYALSGGAPKISSKTRVIVAIGGKAALYPYPPESLLIYCLAPGTKLTLDQHQGEALKVYTSPSVSLSIAKFKELQPSLKRLALLWSGDSIEDYFDDKKAIAERLGIEMISDRVRSPTDLPDHLRALRGKVDAIWLPPDGTLLTPGHFATIREFALANGIPLFVPTDSLVNQGALASVSVSFSEIGALAALMARQAQGKPLESDHVFPERGHLAVNMSTAKIYNLRIAPEILKHADKVVP